MELTESRGTESKGIGCAARQTSQSVTRAPILKRPTSHIARSEETQLGRVICRPVAVGRVNPDCKKIAVRPASCFVSQNLETNKQT